MTKTRTVYEVRSPKNPRWRPIDEPLPSSIVGQRLLKAGDTWSNGYGWEYRRREVEDK